MKQQGRFPVTLVGYGRYGNYIGPKYAKPGYPWHMEAVVDPALDEAAFARTVLGSLKPETRIFSGLERWKEAYFDTLSAEKQQRVVVELALPANIVSRVARQLMEMGVRQIILPKPVADLECDVDALLAAAVAYQAKVAVASQWYYSAIPRIIKRDLARLTAPGSGRRLERARITFSKENGQAVAPAPLCEYPHLLQILHSAGLMGQARRTAIEGTEFALRVHYATPDIAHGITGVAEMDYVRTPAQRDRYPQWEYQERTLYVWASDDAREPLLAVDFWIKFAPSGDSVIYTGRYTTREPDGSVLSHGIAEDLLLQMHEAIFAAFDQPYAAFEADPAVLSVGRYADIGLEIVRVHAQWGGHVADLHDPRPLAESAA
ncbi:MAG: hypothetical protein ACRCTU_07630 [Zoogloea sp.]|uniref:hypothetical protein n=1 Tax=Zoogloea sp. TaxID=49181 RepID=UPI003F2BF179